MADRACLIPTVGHALKRFAGLRSHTPSDSRFRRLLDGFGEDPITSAIHSSHAELGADQLGQVPSMHVVHSKLWRIIQRQMCERSAKASLKPLVTLGKAEGINHARDHDMLTALGDDTETKSDVFFSDNYGMDFSAMDSVEQEEFDDDLPCWSDDERLKEEEESLWHDLDDCDADDILDEDSIDNCRAPLYETEPGLAHLPGCHDMIGDIVMFDTRTQREDMQQQQLLFPGISMDHELGVLCVDMLVNQSAAFITDDPRRRLENAEDSTHQLLREYDDGISDPNTTDGLLLCQDLSLQCDVDDGADLLSLHDDDDLLISATLDGHAASGLYTTKARHLLPQ